MLIPTYYFQRPKELKRMKLQAYDVELVNLVDELGIVDSALLYKLIKLSFPEISDDTTKHRLTKLWRHGFLERPTEQIVLSVRENQNHLLYTIGEEAPGLLARERNKDESKILWRFKAQSKVGYKHLGHQLEIARFMASLLLCARFKIPFSLHDNEFKARVSFPIVTEEQQELFGKTLEGEPAKKLGEKVQLAVVPDRFFALTSKKTDFYCLEVDRGTRSLREMGQKYLAYLKFMEQISQKPLQEQGYEIKSLKILTTAPNIPRIHHLKEQVRKVAEPESEQLLSAFWFARTNQINWQDPPSITQRIWQSPKDEQFLSLLD